MDDLTKVKSILSQGITFLGGAILIFGLINLGLCIKDGMQGGGGQLNGAIAMIVGGGIILAAGLLFSSLGVDFKAK